jgi:hypothetical protein
MNANDEKDTARSFLSVRLADFFSAAYCQLSVCISASDCKRVLASLAFQQDEHGDLLETLQEQLSAQLPGLDSALKVFSLDTTGFSAQVARQCALVSLANFRLLRPGQDVCAAAKSAIKLHALFRQQVCELLAGHGSRFARVRPPAQARRLRGKWARLFEARLPAPAFEKDLKRNPPVTAQRPARVPEISMSQADGLLPDPYPRNQNNMTFAQLRPLGS